VGTRSLTIVQSRWTRGEAFSANAVIYRHWDGYLSGHGSYLAGLLDGVTIVNGKRSTDPEKAINGPGRVAGYIVANMFNDGHEPDLLSEKTDCGQEFEYVVSITGHTEGWNTSFDILVEVYDVPVTFYGQGGENCTRKIFSGTVEEFKTFIAEDSKEKLPA